MSGPSFPERVAALIAYRLRGDFERNYTALRSLVSELADRYPISESRAALARFAEDLASRVREEFADRVGEDLVRAVAARRGEQLIGDGRGVRFAGLGVDATARETAAWVAYRAVDLAEAAAPDEEFVPEGGRLDAWVTANGAAA